MVYEIIDRGNDVTCDAVLVLFVKKINVIVKKQINHNFP